MLVLLRARLRGSLDVRRSIYQLVLLRPSEDHAQMAQFCKQRAIHDAVPAPLGDMRATVGDPKQLTNMLIHVTETFACSQGELEIIGNEAGTSTQYETDKHHHA
jgi:hypothetical protein